jgi:NAD(P)-dependent dehydrogenase (short-subunit alcohol dehydrogenase family)
MILRFDHKTALITGAAGAIGKSIAQGFADGGAKVFITDISQEGVNQAVAELQAAGAQAAGLAANITREAEVAAVVAAAAKFGGGTVDILVNVAGVVGQGKVEEITEAEWDRIFDVNCKGTFFFTKHVVPLMKARQYGKIVNFSSKSGKTGSAIMSAYSAAKAAVIGFTQALAYELADFGITVNCLCPGITDNTGVWSNVSSGYIQNLGKSREDVVKQFTAKVPLKRLAQIDDIVAVTLFMSSGGADYMTGQAINVTGGREMH